MASDAPLRVTVDGIGEVVIPSVGDDERGELYELVRASKAYSMFVCVESVVNSYEATVSFVRVVPFLSIETRAQHRETPEDAVEDALSAVAAAGVFPDDLQRKMRAELEGE